LSLHAKLAFKRKVLIKDLRRCGCKHTATMESFSES
jgi:hypothetical protein